MQLPSNIEDLFVHDYEGLPACKLRNAGEAIMVENALRKEHRSYQTRITRSKKYGREFVILLVDSFKTACTGNCNQGCNCTYVETPSGAT